MILHWLNPQIWDHEYKGAEDTEEPQYRGPILSHMQIFYSPEDQSL